MCGCGCMAVAGSVAARRNLTNEEVDALQMQVRGALEGLGVQLR